MVGMEAFHTRESANEGIRIPLSQPDGGKTTHWIEIFGVDSDHFRTAEAACQRNLATFSNRDDKEAYIEYAQSQYGVLRANLVKSWSFDEECTVENVGKFFLDAPQIADMINKLASDRSLFCKSGTISSKRSPARNSNSTKSRKGKSKASGRA